MPHARFAASLLVLVLGPGVLVGQEPRAHPTFVVEIEAASAWQSYNDVEIPNDGTATRFSLRDLAGAGPWPAGRVQLGWNPAGRHGLRVLVAPFSLTETAVPEGDLRFEGADFAGGVPVEARYTFNSYRLSYRYLLRSREQSRLWLGFTAKVRDAVVALAQEDVASRKDDLGFVPLLHLSGEWRPADGWSLLLETDALAGGPGRAVDATVRLGYDLGHRWTVLAGYRTVEGGADVTEVYAFAWLHYATIALTWRR
jgi:hypothetical protein